MSEETPQQPETFTIDVDQWRREIRMFAESTEQAIGAIVAEFSADGSARHDVETNRPYSLGSGDSHTSDSNTLENNDSVRSAGSSDRLALLKEQLAQRLSKK